MINELMKAIDNNNVKMIKLNIEKMKYKYRTGRLKDCVIELKRLSEEENYKELKQIANKWFVCAL